MNTRTAVLYKPESEEHILHYRVDNCLLLRTREFNEDDDGVDDEDENSNSN
jgi:hypothetical protein